MLALTRKIGERLVIGGNIVLTVVEVRGDSVRLALDAPKEIKIFRGEIYDAIVAENKRAAGCIDVKQIDKMMNSGDVMAIIRENPTKGP